MLSSVSQTKEVHTIWFCLCKTRLKKKSKLISFNRKQNCSSLKVVEVEWEVQEAGTITGEVFGGVLDVFTIQLWFHGICICQNLSCGVCYAHYTSVNLFTVQAHSIHTILSVLAMFISSSTLPLLQYCKHSTLQVLWGKQIWAGLPGTNNYLEHSFLFHYFKMYSGTKY